MWPFAPASSELIDRALERTGYDLAVWLPGGQRRLANVRKLMRLAREHEAGARAQTCARSSIWSPGAYARLGDGAGKARESEAPVEGGRSTPSG